MSLDIGVECACCGSGLYNANITHNMRPLWSHLGCYDALYESHGKLASDVLPELRAAVAALSLQSDEDLAQFNPANGWGSVEIARPWLLELAEAFERTPSARVSVSR